MYFIQVFGLRRVFDEQRRSQTAQAHATHVWIVRRSVSEDGGGTKSRTNMRRGRAATAYCAFFAIRRHSIPSTEQYFYTRELAVVNTKRVTDR